MSFGVRIKDLRRQARLSQRELADLTAIDFTYLSKIENERVEPPSEVVIKRLAREFASRLNVDEVELTDELTTLAGKIPSDLVQTLSQNQDILQYLRSLTSDAKTAADWADVIKQRSPDKGSE